MLTKTTKLNMFDSCQHLFYDSCTSWQATCFGWG